MAFVVRRKGLRKEGKYEAQALSCSPPDKAQGAGRDPRGAFKGAHCGERRSTQTQPQGDSICGSNIMDRRDWRPHRTECGHLVNKHNAQNSEVKFKFSKAHCENTAWRGKILLSNVYVTPNIMRKTKVSFNSKPMTCGKRGLHREGDKNIPSPC